jgi:hypothetical protein
MRRPALVVLLVLAWTEGSAQYDSEADGWEWNLTPYLWLPTIDGRLKYELPADGGGAPDVSIGPVDWFELLNFGALAGISASKDRFIVFTDFMYLSMASDNEGQLISAETPITISDGTIVLPVSADLNIATGSDLDGLLWMMSAGYAFAESDAATHHVFAGVRFLSVDLSTEWNLSGEVTGPNGETILDARGEIGEDVDLWDAIVGLKGHFNLGEGGEDGWSLPYTVDVGTGDSDLVWSATASLSRQYGWGSLIVGYRHLEYDQDQGGLLQDLSLSGPGIGANFRF